MAIDKRFLKTHSVYQQRRAPKYRQNNQHLHVYNSLNTIVKQKKYTRCVKNEVHNWTLRSLERDWFKMPNRGWVWIQFNRANVVSRDLSYCRLDTYTASKNGFAFVLKVGGETRQRYRPMIALWEKLGKIPTTSRRPVNATERRDLWSHISGTVCRTSRLPTWIIHTWL